MNKQSHKLTTRQIQILEALGIFQYLTADQLKRLFGLETVSYINKQLKILLEAQTKWIGEKDFGFHPALGRLPKLYFLKPA